MNTPEIPPYLGAGLAQGMVVALDRLHDYHFHHGMFVGSCVLYWAYYDRCRNGYLSRIYRNDKYGVVINYTVASLAGIYDLLFHNDLTIFSGAVQVAEVQTSLQSQVIRAISSNVEIIMRLLTGMVVPDQLWNSLIPHPEEDQAFIEGARKNLDDMGEGVMYLRRRVVATLVKIALFNMIFKNNTSEERVHQTVHLGFVITLGAFSTGCTVVDAVLGVRDKKSTSIRLGIAAGCALTYSVAGFWGDRHWREIQRKEGAHALARQQADLEAENDEYSEDEDERLALDQDPVPRRDRILGVALNFLTMLAESILVAMSID